MILFAVVALAPLPFGSTAPIVVAAWCAILGAALLLASPRGLRRTQLVPLAGMAAVAAATAVVLYGQLSGAPWLGVSADPKWQEAARLLDSAIDAPLSVVRNEPLAALGAPLAALLALAVSTIVCADRHHARALFSVIAWSGTVYAFCTMVLFLIDPTMLLWREKAYYVSSLTGTFLGRSTAAAYFGSCAIVCLLLFLQDLSSRRHDQGLRLENLWAAFGKGRAAPSWPAAVSLFRLVVLVAALLMTQSRAGVVFSLIGLVAAFILLQARHFGRRQYLWVSVAAGVGVVLVVLQTLGGALGTRFDQSGLTDAARLDAYRSTLRMIADHPWLGTGLGTFASAFPPYRADGAIWGTWNRAHNTLLEIGADMGVPFMLVAVAAGGLILALLVHGIRTRRRDLYMPIAALCVACVSIVHSMVDFPLQIPGYAIVVFALIGAGMAQSYSGRQPAADLR